MITSALPLAERSDGQFSRVGHYRSSGSSDMQRAVGRRKVQWHTFVA